MSSDPEIFQETSPETPKEATEVSTTTRQIHKKTIEFYWKNGESALRKYYYQTGKAWQEEPMALVHWFAEQLPTWRKSTFKVMRYSLLHVLGIQGAPKELLEALRGVPYQVEPKIPTAKKTAKDPGRVKSFPPQDLDKYVRLLRERTAYRGIFDELLWRFLEWNIHVGLRPSELGDARIGSLAQGEPDRLIIRNKKVNEVRGNGTHRILEIPEDMLEKGRALLEERDRLLSSGFTWKEMQHGMMMRMNQIRHEIGGRSYTLYSTRHQFVANAKASRWAPRDLADAIGHRSIETAQSHYGRRVSGKTTGWHAPTHAEGVWIDKAPPATPEPKRTAADTPEGPSKESVQEE